MSSFLQTAQGDFDFATAPGQLTVVTDVAQCAAQKLRNRLLFFLGEWFLDTRLGVPYRQLVLIKNPDIPTVRQVIRRVILSIPEFTAIRYLNVAYNPGARTCVFSFSLQVSDGQIVTGGSNQPFIVSQS